MDSAHLCLVREDCGTEANRLAAELKDCCLKLVVEILGNSLVSYCSNFNP